MVKSGLVLARLGAGDAEGFGEGGVFEGGKLGRVAGGFGGQVDGDVGRDADLAEGLTKRGVELGGGQTEAGIDVVQREDALNGTFAVAFLAN